MNVMQQTQLQETAADSATLHAPGNDWYRRRSRALSIARTDAGTFLTELESSLAAVNLEIKAVLDDEFRPTPQHVAAVRQLAMLDNTMATYNRSTSGPIQAGALFMRWLAAKGGARVRVAPTVVQDEGDVRLLQFDEQRGRTNVTRMHTRGAVVETFVRLCVQGARPVQKHEHATCTVVAVAKTPAMHGVVQNVLEPLPAMALHYKLSDSLEAPRGFKLFQGFIKSRGRRSVVYRVAKDRSKQHASGFAISSAYQYTSFDESYSVKDADRAQQLQFNTAQELYEAVCAGQAATEKAAVERHCIRLQKTVGRFYTTSLTKRGTFSDETVNSVRVSKVQAGMLSEVQDMMEHLMKFVEAAVLRETMRRVKFAELVADFTLDEDSRWWLLQVKAFRLQAPFASLPKQPTPVWVNGLGENGSKISKRCQVCGQKISDGECAPIPVRSAYYLIRKYRDAKLPLTEWATTFLSRYMSDLHSDRLKLSELQVFGCAFCVELLAQSDNLAAGAALLTTFLSRPSNRDREAALEIMSVSTRTTATTTSRSGASSSSTTTASGSTGRLVLDVLSQDICPYQLVVTCHHILHADLPSYHRLRGRPAQLLFSIGPHEPSMWFRLDYETESCHGNAHGDKVIPVRQTRMFSVLGTSVDLRKYFESKKCDLHLLVQQGDGFDDSMADAFSVFEGTAMLSFAGLRFDRAEDESSCRKVDLLLPMQCFTLGVLLIKLTVAIVNIAELDPEYAAWSGYSGQTSVPVVREDHIYWLRKPLSASQPLPPSLIAVMCQSSTRSATQHSLGSPQPTQEPTTNTPPTTIPANWNFSRDQIHGVFLQQMPLADGRVPVRYVAQGVEQLVAAAESASSMMDGSNKIGAAAGGDSGGADGVLVTEQYAQALRVIAAFLWQIVQSATYPSAMHWAQLVATLRVMWNERQPRLDKAISEAIDHTAQREALLRSTAQALPPSNRRLGDSEARQIRRLHLLVDLFAGDELGCSELEAGELHSMLQSARSLLTDELERNAVAPWVVPAVSGVAYELSRLQQTDEATDTIASRFASGILAHNLLVCCEPLNETFDSYFRQGTGIVTLEQFLVFAESTIQDIGKREELQQQLLQSRLWQTLQSGPPQLERTDRFGPASTDCNCNGLCEHCPSTRATLPCSLHNLSCFDLRDMFCLACERKHLGDHSERFGGLSAPLSPPHQHNAQESVLTKVRAFVRRESKVIRQEIDLRGLGTREEQIRRRTLTMGTITEDNDSEQTNSD